MGNDTSSKQKKRDRKLSPVISNNVYLGSRGRRGGLAPTHIKVAKQMKLWLTLVENGNTTQLSEQLSAGADLAEMDTSSELLMKACEKGNTDIVTVLLHYGAPIDVYGQEESTPLQTCITKGHSTVLTMLLNHGADINACTKFEKRCPLHLAVIANEENLVKLLLQRDADVNRGDIYGSSPLHLATCLGNKSIVELLLEHNADINKYNNEGWTALHLASEAGKVEIVDLLIQHQANLDVQTKYGRTPLHWAVASEQVPAVQKLLDADADVDIEDSHEKKAVQYCANASIRKFFQIYRTNAVSETNFQAKSCMGDLIAECSLEQSSGLGFRRSSSVLDVPQVLSQRRKSTVTDIVQYHAQRRSSSVLNISQFHAKRRTSSALDIAQFHAKRRTSTASGFQRKISGTSSSITTISEEEEDDIDSEAVDDLTSSRNQFLQVVTNSNRQLNEVEEKVEELNDLLQAAINEGEEEMPMNLLVQLQRQSEETQLMLSNFKHDLDFELTKLWELFDENLTALTSQLSQQNPLPPVLYCRFIFVAGRHVGLSANGWKVAMGFLPADSYQDEEGNLLKVMDPEMNPVSKSCNILLKVFWMAHNQHSPLLKFTLEFLEKCNINGVNLRKILTDFTLFEKRSMKAKREWD